MASREGEESGQPYGNGFTSVEGGDRDDFPFQIPGQDQQAGRPNAVDKFPVEPAPRFPGEGTKFRLDSAIVQIVSMVPERVLGMLQKVRTIGTPSPSIVSYKGRQELVGEDLVALIHTQAQNQVSGENPFASFAWTPGSNGFPADLYQSIVATAFLEMGALGVNETIHFNVPSDQFVRIPFNAHTGRVWGAIEPKYYLRLTAPGGSDYDFTWITTTSNSLRNTLFNNPPQGTVDANGPPLPAIWPPAVDVRIRGIIGRGTSIPSFTTSQLSSRPLRRFFGWVDLSAGAGVRYRCPVPRGAVAVMLLSDASAATAGGGVTAQLLQFRTVKSGPAGAAGEYLYNFQPNQIYQLPSDIDAIDVYSATAVPAGRSLPFQLIFELGF